MGETIGTFNEGERRRFSRIETLGRAIVSFGQRSNCEYWVENLSAGGALLTGGPLIEIGQTVRVVLRIGAIPQMGIDARVVWQFRGTKPGIAVEFLNLDAEMEDLMCHAVVLFAPYSSMTKPTG